MFYELDNEGRFVCDALSTEGLENWTKQQPPQPCVAPYMVGKRSKKTGEWKGEWHDVPDPDTIEQGA